MSLSRQSLTPVLTNKMPNTQNKPNLVTISQYLSTVNRYKKTQKTQKPLVCKSTSENEVTRGWLPERAGSPVLNSGGRVL